MAFNKVSGIVGGAGSGKTTELLRIAKQYLAKGMKVLIYDDFDHPSYRHVPTITISQFPYWKSGMYRIIHPDVNEVYKAINDNVWNALIVFEDCFKYVGDTFTKPMLRFVIDAKQKNLDIMFMYHCWGWVTLDMSRRCDAWVLLKTNDTPAVRFSKKGTPYLDSLMAEHSLVIRDSNPFKKKLFTTKING